MKIEKIILRRMKMDFKTPFMISNAKWTYKEFIMVEAHTKEHVGYGDCSAFAQPYYSEETTQTAWHMLTDFLIPLVFSKDTIDHPEELSDLFAHIRRNNMAKAALDCAVWDLYAKSHGISLAKALGGVRTEVETGISIGVQKSEDDLCRIVEKGLEDGYRRIKCKIKPGKDLTYLRAVRDRFGDVMLMADANSAYTLNDLACFKEMDQLNLLMIEQPLSHDDIVDHAKLQKVMKTPICLDESIHSVEDARKAIELGSTKTINIKVARVGGLTEARKIHDLCMAHHVPVWCGGMLDTGIARAHNVAIATLPNYKYPGDIPSSTRYWNEDLIQPLMNVSMKSTVPVLNKPGIGYAPVSELIDKYTVSKIEMKRAV